LGFSEEPLMYGDFFDPPPKQNNQEKNIKESNKKSKKISFNRENGKYNFLA